MWARRQRPGQLFRKYVVICFGLVSSILLTNGLLDLYFTTVYPGDKSVLYRNSGGWKFEEPGARSPQVRG